MQGSLPGLGRSPGKGNSNPLQYSCLGNPLHREAWWTTVHGVAKSWIQLSDLHTHTHTHTEATNMSFNRLMEMQTMRHPDNGRVFNAKKKWAIKHGKTLEEFSMCIAKWKKTIWKATYLDGPNYKTLWKKQKLQSQWKDHWLPAVWGGKDEWVEHRGFLGQENYSVWHYHVGYMLHIHQNP